MVLLPKAQTTYSRIPRSCKVTLAMDHNRIRWHTLPEKILEGASRFETKGQSSCAGRPYLKAFENGTGSGLGRFRGQTVVQDWHIQKRLPKDQGFHAIFFRIGCDVTGPQEGPSMASGPTGLSSSRDLAACVCLCGPSPGKGQYAPIATLSIYL